MGWQAWKTGSQYISLFRLVGSRVMAPSSQETLQRSAMFHTRYTQAGGEERSTAVETATLRAHGIEVEEFQLANQDVLNAGRLATVRGLWRSAFNRQVYEQVRQFCRRVRPQVAHVQNFWWAMSPAVHAACHAEGVATVQTLRNYRLLCVNALLQREGAPCEACVGKAPWRGVLHRCYHGSAVGSALVARMITHNRRRATWHRDVDVLVALTNFARGKLIEGGLPAERLVVKPNSAPDPGAATPPGQGAVFLGRLSAEKGLHTLLDAWRCLPEVPLTILGDGPLRAELEARVAEPELRHVRLLGQQPADQVTAAVRESAFLVMASEWYEGFPRVLVEAFSLGRPALVPKLGSMAEIVDDGRTGLHFEPGDAVSLAAQACLLAEDRDRLLQLATAARAEYEACYTPDRDAERLLGIYRQALDQQAINTHRAR